MANFKKYTNSTVEKYVKKRQNEVKLGEKVHIGNLEGQYVVIGVPESVGVKANFGVGGTETLWTAFLSNFLNIQSTEKLSGADVSIFGYFDFAPSVSVAQIDDAVEKITLKIALEGKIPIVIGGGHNNAYPILKGVSKAKNQVLNAINLDAHSDFRRMEGRHSGNGFRYAYTEGYLKKYAMIGLHESYNAQNIIEEIVKNPDIQFSLYEDIFVRAKINYVQAILDAVDFTRNAPVGIELDLDCIENTLSSAMSPCGVSTLQARQYLYHTAKNCDIAYLHITEGATQLDSGLKNPLTGKLVSYLVSDFLKATI
ncbi:MAG: formimidoylglutamase [Saprospiraceae bacterium]|nr:formimidoylglutamase [Saprospiraceae bacterium]